MSKSIITASQISGSLVGTGSFGAIHMPSTARIGFGTTTPGQAIDLRDGRIIMNNNYGYIQRDAAGNSATLLNQDGSDVLKVGDANHTDTIKLQTSQGLGMHISTGGIIINQDGDDINFRVESNNDTHALFIDGGKDSVSIGSNAADNNNHEKLTVAGNVGITGSLHVSGNISTSGSIIAKEFRTEFVNQIIATSSGSTTFGDDLADTHRFTGSVNITGSLTIPTGSISVRGGVGGTNIANFSRNVGASADIDIHAGGGDPQITFTANRDFSIGHDISENSFKISENTAVGTNDRFIITDAGKVGIGATNSNIAAQLEVQAPTGSAPMQIRPSDPSTALNPLIMFRSQLNGTVNYLMAGNGGHLYFATYDSGTPTDVSKMIRFSPDATLSPKMYMGDDGSAESTFRVGGPSNGVFLKGGASGSMVSSSRLGSGSLGYLKIAGQHQTKKLEVSGSVSFTYGLRLGRQDSNERGLIVLEKNNNGDDTGLAWLNTGGSYSATMYVSKSVGDFVFANTGVSGDLTTQNPNFVISSSGDVRMNSGAKLLLDNADAEGHTYIQESTNDVVDHYVGGTNLLRLEESGTDYVQVFDNTRLTVGTGKDLEIYHDGSNTYIENEVGDFQIFNKADDKDIILSSDDGSGGTTAYLTLDGSVVRTLFDKPAQFNDELYVADNAEIRIGNGNDLRLLHNGSNSFIDNYTGNLYIRNHADDQDIYIQGDDGGGNTITALSIDISDAGTTLFNHDIRLLDNGRYYMGTGNDFQMFHDGTNSAIENLTGALYITNHADDQDIIFRTDDGGTGASEVLRIDASDNGRVKLPNDNQRLAIGASDDIQITHDGTNSYFDNYTGDLIIKNNEADKDIILKSDDGSGGETAYLTLDGSVGYTQAAVNIRFADNAKLQIGASADLELNHDGTDSTISNKTGDLYITNTLDDKDIIFRSDDGSGGVTSYFYLDGSATKTIFAQSTQHADNAKATFGAAGDMEIYHNGTNSIINNTTGHLHISSSAQDKDIIFSINDGGSVITMLTLDGSGQIFEFHNRGVYGLNNIQFNDPGSGEGISWAGGSWNIFICPDDMSNANGNLQFVSGSAGAGRTNGHIAMRGHSEATLSAAVKTQLYMPSSSLEIGDASAAGANVANAARVNIVSQGNERTLQLTAKNEGTNGSYTTTMMFRGYEGRGMGTFYTDENYSGHEWFAGVPYQGNATRWQIGYDDGGLSEYQSSGSIIIYANDKVLIGNGVTGYDLNVYGRTFINDGSEGSPAYSFLNDTNTGIYRGSSDDMGFVAGGTKRFAANGNGLDLQGNDANKIVHTNAATRDKYRLWTSSHYAIGMDNAMSYGGLNDYAMTFQMNSESDRGFVFLDSSHSDAQGAMSLTTDGKMVVATSISVGAGESTTSAAATTLDVNGTSNFTGNIFIDHGGSDYSPNIQFMGGSNTPGSNTYENALIGYYDNSGTGTMLFEGKRGAMNWQFNDSDECLFFMASDGDFHAHQDVVAFSSVAASDRRLKDNIKTIPNALDKVMNLRGVEFDWNVDSKKGQHDIGLIAQEVEEIIPEVVKDKPMIKKESDGKNISKDEETYKTISYDKLVGLLVESTKEQQKQIEDLKKEIKELKK